MKKVYLSNYNLKICFRIFLNTKMMFWFAQIAYIKNILCEYTIKSKLANLKILLLFLGSKFSNSYILHL